MAAAGIATLLAAGRLVGQNPPLSLFRPAPPMSQAELVVRTSVQALVLWVVFLVVLPWMLTQIEAASGLRPAHISVPARVTGAAIPLAGSTLNSWAAYRMLRDGLGTPLPTQTARQLVRSGPYRWIRNSMAVGGLTQGMGVAIAIASPLTAAYVLLGGLVWHVLIRPAEEMDLQARFGNAVDTYRASVRCWVPRLR